MPINSRAKGANFERDIAKILTDWWGFQFRRVPLSGGYDKRFVVGDLWIADGKAKLKDILEFPFSIEAKNREAWDFNCLFGPGNKELNSYWEQAEQDALNKNKIPLLIFTKNRMPIYIMWSENTGISSVNIDRVMEFKQDSTQARSISLLENWIHVFNKQKIQDLLYFNKALKRKKVDIGG